MSRFPPARAGLPLVFLVLVSACGTELPADVRETDDNMNTLERQLGAGGDTTALCINYVWLCQQATTLCLEGNNAQIFQSFCSTLGPRCRNTVETHCRTAVDDAGNPDPDGGPLRPDAGSPRPDAGTPRPDAGAPNPSGPAYYIAPNGSSSNPGTLLAPFATIQDAHNVAAAGDTIYLRGGTYRISSIATLTKSGTAERPIRLWAYPGELPVLDAASLTTEPAWVIVLNGASWWHIRGLEIRNNLHGGAIRISSHANQNIIEANNTHHNGGLSTWAATGIVLYGNGANNLILNNDSHHNKDPDNGDADGFDIASTGAGNVVRGNRAWNNSDDGIDLFNINDNLTCGAVLIENNWVWANGYDDHHVPFPGGNGNGFKLGGTRRGTTGTSGGHLVRRNLAWGNVANGIDENSSNTPLTIFNNTSWANGALNYSFWSNLHTLRNNLSVGAFGSASGAATYNSWNLAVTVSPSDFESMDDACARGPRQADGSLPNCSFLRLVAGSDLLDKGIDVGLPFTNQAPDLGAFER